MAEADMPTTDDAAEALCPRCQKPLAVCVCDAVAPLDNRVEVVVLQHPQEQDKVLGTGLLTTLHLRRARFRIGLSWSSLSAAVGRPVDPKRWAVLYLGPIEHAAPAGDLIVADAKGGPLADQSGARAALEGILLLDGSWSQAKTLWWRNPWVLKARHLIIGPTTPSLYGKLRREPRRDGLSTLEATAFALSRIEGRPDIEAAMLSTFRRMLQRYRDSRPPKPAQAITPRGARRPRRKRADGNRPAQGK
jgi:DTW domain-containing protein YfiP